MSNKGRSLGRRNICLVTQHNLSVMQQEGQQKITLKNDQRIMVIQTLQSNLLQQQQRNQFSLFNFTPFGNVIDISTKQGSELDKQGTKKFDAVFDRT